ALRINYAAGDAVDQCRVYFRELEIGRQRGLLRAAPGEIDFGVETAAHRIASGSVDAEEQAACAQHLNSAAGADQESICGLVIPAAPYQRASPGFVQGIRFDRAANPAVASSGPRRAALRKLE